MRISVLIFCLALLISCESKKKDYAPVHQEVSQNKVVVKEVQQAADYTYLKVEEGGKQYWMAVSKTAAEEGQTLYYADAMEMKDFESKELGKIFDQILFVDQISSKPIDTDSKKAAAIAKVKKDMQVLLDSIKVSPPPSGHSISEIYEKAEDFNGKAVTVRGQVIKVNNNIMDHNWVHLMDGTKGENRSDLTFSTYEVVKVGDTVTFEGVLATDKDFGAGYVYPVIIENAVLK